MSSFVYIQIGANFLLGQWTDDVARRMTSQVIEDGNITVTSGTYKGSYKEADKNFISAYAGIMFFIYPKRCIMDIPIWRTTKRLGSKHFKKRFSRSWFWESRFKSVLSGVIIFKRI